MAGGLAKPTVHSPLLVKQLPDGDLWSTISSGFHKRSRTLEKCGELVIFERAGFQLGQCEKCHGHESCLWGVSKIDMS